MEIILQVIRASCNSLVIAHKNARENMLVVTKKAYPGSYTDETAVSLGGIEVRVFHMGTGLPMETPLFTFLI